MKYYLRLAVIMSCVLLGLFTVGCASMRPPVVKTYGDDIFNYRYFVVSPTEDYTYTTPEQSGASGQQQTYWHQGSKTQSINPGSAISGILVGHGFIPVKEVDTSKVSETMIVNFGESGRRSVNMGYSIEVTIQFVSAKTMLPICSCTAEGQGATEVDDVREAIQRAMNSLFKTE